MRGAGLETLWRLDSHRLSLRSQIAVAVTISVQRACSSGISARMNNPFPGMNPWLTGMDCSKQPNPTLPEEESAWPNELLPTPST